VNHGMIVILILATSGCLDARKTGGTTSPVSDAGVATKSADDDGGIQPDVALKADLLTDLPPANDRIAGSRGAGVDGPASALDGAGPSGGDIDWVNCGQESFKPGVSADEFCAKYMTACTFDPTGGASSTDRYRSLSDCVMKYSALTDGARGGKACVAWHVCIASHSAGNAMTFCPNAPRASAMDGPCKPSYL
jgi:hypothetical protein